MERSFELGVYQPRLTGSAAGRRQNPAIARSGELAAGGGDLASPREPDRGRKPRAVEHRFERRDRLPRRPVEASGGE
jgi:hypothetical protein